MADKAVNLNIRIREETRDKLKRKARQLGTTYSELISKWIEDFVGEGEETPPLINDKEESNDIIKEIESLREEMEAKLESLQRDYQYNDEQYSNDIKTKISQLEGEVEKEGSAIKYLQEQALTTQYVDQRLAQALEVLWEQLDYSEEKMMENIEGIICDPLKNEPQPSPEESNDLREVKEVEGATRAKYEGLTQSDLAKRLNKSPNTVKNWIREKGDEEWSKKNDPEGLIWKFDEKKKIYFTESSTSMLEGEATEQPLVE